MLTINLILFFAWAFFALYWVISAWRNQSASLKKYSGEFFLPFLILVILIGEMYDEGLTLHQSISGNIMSDGGGILICGIGLGFACWARYHLGRNWSSLPEIKKDHTLIQTGPYHIVRHPIYTGFFFGIIGTVLAIGSASLLFMVLAVMIVFVIKIHYEEKLLKDKFPAEYEKYQKEVKSFIPFLI